MTTVPVQAAIDPTPAAPAEPPPVAVAEPPPAPVELPAFARLESDLELLFPLRATIRRVGTQFESVEGEGAVEGDGRAVLLPTFAVEDGAGTAPRRVRVLCEAASHRLAMYVEAKDLVVTVRDEELMVAALPRPARRSERTPGIRLRPGAAIEVLRPGSKGFVRVRHQGAAIVAKGWVAARAIDVVHTGERLESNGRVNAQLLGAVRLLDRPGGRELARIGADADVRPWVERLGPRKGKFVLVRYEEDDIEAVGWVLRTDVRVRVGEVEREAGMLGVIGSAATSDGVRLQRGTPLFGLHTQAPIGVVTSDEAFRCVADCDTQTPVVRADACASAVDVRARAPR